MPALVGTLIVFSGMGIGVDSLTFLVEQVPSSALIVLPFDVGFSEAIGHCSTVAAIAQVMT